MSYGKIKAFFEGVFGIVLCRATFCRADYRLAKRAEPTYVQLIFMLREKKVVYSDETGWKIGGKNCWLWVFKEMEITVYVIDFSRGDEVVLRVLEREFGGVLGCDGFLAYDALDYRQKKCLGHILRGCKEIEAIKSRGAVILSRRVASLLGGAINLKRRDEGGKISFHGYKVARGKLEEALERILDGNFTDEDKRKLLEHLRKHRDKLFVFLYEEGVEATNNRAERGLRGGVIVREVGGCNRSERGAKTHSILASIIQTCRQQGKDFLELAKELLKSKEALVLPLVGEVAVAVLKSLGEGGVKARVP